MNWGAKLVGCGAIGNSLSTAGRRSATIFLDWSRQLEVDIDIDTRKGDIDMEKTPDMKAAAVWKFGEQWCRGWWSTVVAMSDRGAAHGRM